MYKGKIVSIISMVAIMVLGINTGVLAHKMVINPIGEGQIRVEYDGGNPATRSQVKAMDKDGNIVDQGPVDEEGIYTFDKEKVSYIEADDGMGHKDKWEVGEAIKTSGGSKLVKIGLVLVLLLGISIYFSKKK